MNKLHLLRASFGSIVLLTQMGLVHAADCVWLGGSGNWTDNNWDLCLGVFPNSNDTAFISTGSITLNQNITLQGLSLSGGTITGINNLTVSGLSTWTGGTMADGGKTEFLSNLNITGDGGKGLKTGRVIDTTGITTWGGNTNNLNNQILLSGAGGSIINNSGTWNDTNNFDARIVTSTGSGHTFNNTGTYNKLGSNVSTIQAAFTNSGRVNINNGVLHTTTDYVQTAGETIVEGTLRVSGLNTAVQLQGGVLSGNGTIDAGSVNNVGGTIGPGLSPGTLTILNDYTQDINSTLAIEIGGLTQGSEYDFLNIFGDATLAGSLDVDLFDLGSGLFAPSLGDSFDILAAETITGEFDLLTLAVLGNGLGWQLDYLFDEIGTIDIARLSVVSAVPVPAAVWLFGSGLIGLIGLARRKVRSQY